MTTGLWIALAAFGLAVLGFIGATVRAHAGRPGVTYCTKHELVRGWMGGPERLVWIYGPHRTPGNACDGNAHRRRLGILP